MANKTCGRLSFSNPQFLLLAFISLGSFQTCAFTQSSFLKIKAAHNSGDTRCITFLRRRNGQWNQDGDNEPEHGQRQPTVIPQLPAVGASSFGVRKSSMDSTEVSPDHLPGSFSQTALVGTKFELQYTCNVCETRNFHRVSRLAYRQGVVIARCKGCGSRHLIADNLGWTDYKGGFEGDVNDIEQFFASQGKDDVVNRVSQEVFELEKVLSHDTKSGSIVGENGQLHME